MSESVLHCLTSSQSSNTRRACPGIHLAKASMFIMLATFIALFDLEKAKDKDGNEISVRVEHTDGLVRYVVQVVQEKCETLNARGQLASPIRMHYQAERREGDRAH